jgi:hypothetical protein
LEVVLATGAFGTVIGYGKDHADQADTPAAFAVSLSIHRSLSRVRSQTSPPNRFGSSTGSLSRKQIVAIAPLVNSKIPVM